jgi:hypothetical protein
MMNRALDQGKSPRPSPHPIGAANRLDAPRTAV